MTRLATRPQVATAAATFIALQSAAVPGAAPFASSPTAPSRSSKPIRPTVLQGGYLSEVGIDPNTPLQFFTTPGNTCPYAARVYIVLKELDVPFDLTEVSGRPKPDWYLNTINPRGKVPAIKVPAEGNEVVYESAICCEYLCDANDGNTLMPEGPGGAMERARIRLLNDHCDTVFTPTQFTFLMNKEADKDAELAEEMEDALMAYEDALKESGGPYLMGEDFTLADVHILPFMQRFVVSLRHFKGYELPPARLPKLLEWYARCSERESVKAAALTEEKIVEIYTIFVGMDYSFGGLNKN